MNQNQLSQLLRAFRDGAISEDEALARAALELATMIRNGDPGLDDRLAALQESGTATGWIELGWVLTGDLDSRLEAVVNALSSGEVSEPTAARGGLHVLQALDVEESTIEEFQDVRDRIEASERARLFEQEAQTYLEELIASSYVVSKPPPEAASFDPLAGLSPAREEVQEGG